MSLVCNHNHGSGTFNNVTGDQINNFAGSILFFDSTSAPVISPTAVITANGPYQDIVLNTSGVCKLLQSFMGSQQSPPQILLQEVLKFARVIAYVAKALEIIDGIPGKLKTLQHFEQVRILVRGYNLRLHAMYQDIQTYETQLHKYMAAGLWRGLLLHIFTRYHWATLSSNVNDYLEENRPVLERFLHFLASRCWRKIIDDEYGQDLEMLVNQVGLQPDPSVYQLRTLSILVRDHLGRLLPIPMEFCTSWPDFEIVVKHYCRNVEGSDFVQHDDWEIVHTTDNRVIDKSSFTSFVEPGMEFDMSIIIQALVSSMFICPRCNSDNSRRNSYNGWINCHKCDKEFRVVSILPSNQALAGALESGQRTSHVADSKSNCDSLGWAREILYLVLKYVQALLLWFRRRLASSQWHESMEITDTIGEGADFQDAYKAVVAVDSQEGSPEVFKPRDLPRGANPKFNRISVQVRQIIQQPFVSRFKASQWIHEETVSASADQDAVSHGAVDEMGADNSSQTVSQPSDKPTYGRVFVKVLGVNGINLPIPEQPTAVTCALDNGIHYVTTPEVQLDRDYRIDQEFELIEHANVEFTLTLKVRLDPHVIALFRALAPPPPSIASASPPPSAIRRLSSKGMRNIFRSPLQRPKVKHQSPPSMSQPQPNQELEENLARYLMADGTLGRASISLKEIASRCDARLFQTSYPIVGQRLEQNRTRSSIQIGEIVLHIFRLPPVPGIPPDQLPQSSKECIQGLEWIRWHKVTYHEGILTQNGGDCSTWRRRQFRVIGRNLVALDDVVKEDVARIDLKKVIAVEEGQEDLRGFPSNRFVDDFEVLQRSFYLKFAEGQDIVFLAETDEEKSRWLEILRTLVGHIPPYPLWAERVWQGQTSKSSKDELPPNP